MAEVTRSYLQAREQQLKLWGTEISTIPADVNIVGS